MVLEIPCKKNSRHNVLGSRTKVSGIPLIYVESRVPYTESITTCFVREHLTYVKQETQVAQWKRICLPMQETQEMPVLFLGGEDSPRRGNGNPL